MLPLGYLCLRLIHSRLFFSLSFTLLNLQEAPERVTAIMARLADPQLFPAHEVVVSDAVPLATDAQLLRAHSAAYVRLVRALAKHVARHNTAVPFTPHIQRGLQVRCNCGFRAGAVDGDAGDGCSVPPSRRE